MNETVEELSIKVDEYERQLEAIKRELKPQQKEQENDKVDEFVAQMNNMFGKQPLHAQNTTIQNFNFINLEQQKVKDDASLELMESQNVDLKDKISVLESKLG